MKILYKVKQSHYRPGQALSIPGGLGSQIWRQSAQEGGKVGSPTHWPPLTLPQDIFLVLISVRGWVDPRVIVWLEGLCQWKDPMTPTGIKHATFQLVGENTVQNSMCSIQGAVNFTVCIILSHKYFVQQTQNGLWWYHAMWTLQQMWIQLTQFQSNRVTHKLAWNSNIIVFWEVTEASLMEEFLVFPRITVPPSSGSSSPRNVVACSPNDTEWHPSSNHTLTAELQASLSMKIKFTLYITSS